MHNSEVLSHPTFVGAPAGGTRRRGRYPKNVVKIEEARERRFHAIEDRRVRAWAHCAGVDPSQPIDELRDKKRWHDAVNVLDRSRDAELYRSLERLSETQASILVEMARLREKLIERYRTEAV